MKKLIFLIILPLFVISCITIYAPSSSPAGAPLSKPKIKEIKKSFDFSPHSTLRMDAQVGVYKIEGKPLKKLLYTGTVSGSTPDFFYDVDFSIRKEKENLIVLKTSVFKKSIKEVDITGKILLPFETNIIGKFSEAKVTVNSVRGNINLVGEYLNSTLVDVSGNIKVKADSGHIRLTILEWEKGDSYSVELNEGDIEFFAPKEAKLTIITEASDNKITKKYEFKKGETKVFLKIRRGDIIIDKI